MTLDTHKIELLSKFFEYTDYPDFKKIGYKLIHHGKCIAPIVLYRISGGIGNFIKFNHDLPNHLNCVEYSFNVDEFIGSRFFQDSLPAHINSVAQEIKSLKAQLKEKEEEFKSIKELEYEKIP